MKKFLGLVFSAAVVAGVAMSLVGCGSPTTEKSKEKTTTTTTTTPGDESKKFEGTITSIDKDKETITVKVGDDKKDYVLKDTGVKVADFKVDEKVTVTTTKDGKVTKVEEKK